jgi:hypothetical protein
MNLRRRLFGDVVTGFTRCPGCGEPVEVSFGIGDVLPPETMQTSGGVVMEQGFEIGYRTPTSSDLLELSDEEESGAHESLLARCVQYVRCDGSESRLDTVPAQVLDCVVDALEAADPAARLELELDCPECGRRWLEPFDIVAFLWAEVDHWAHQRMGEVHRLALAYGWREHDILAMPVRRRQTYLELIGP